MSSILIA